MAIDIEKERKGFESHMQTHPGAGNGLLYRWDSGGYKMYWVQMMFDGWLARANSASAVQEGMVSGQINDFIERQCREAINVSGRLYIRLNDLIQFAASNPLYTSAPTLPGLVAVPRELHVDDGENGEMYSAARVEDLVSRLWAARTNTCSEDAMVGDESLCSELNDGWDLYEGVLVLRSLADAMRQASLSPDTSNVDEGGV